MQMKPMEDDRNHMAKTFPNAVTEGGWSSFIPFVRGILQNFVEKPGECIESLCKLEEICNLGFKLKRR